MKLLLPENQKKEGGRVPPFLLVFFALQAGSILIKRNGNLG